MDNTLQSKYPWIKNGNPQKSFKSTLRNDPVTDWTKTDLGSFFEFFLNKISLIFCEIMGGK